MLPQRPIFSCISVDMLLASCIQSFSFRKYLASFEFSHFAFCNFVASISCSLFFIYSVWFRLLLLPHGVRIFGTNLHRFEKFGLWRQRHRQHRLWKKGTYQKSFLGGKLRAFCGLHLIAKWSCFIYVISDLFCRMSLLYFCIFWNKKKVASI